MTADKQLYVKPEDLTIIGHDTEDGPEHDLWDKRASKPVDMKFVESILDMGVMEPVIVYENDGRLEVVAGRRRTKAARKGNEILKERGEKRRIEVPYIVIAQNDAKTLFKAVVVENAQREDLNPLEEAALVQRAVERKGADDQPVFDMKEVALMFGVNAQTIRNRLQLMRAAKEVKQALSRGEISSTAALKLAALESEAQVDALKEMLQSGKTGSKSAARAARARKKSKKNGHAAATEYDPPGKRLLRKVVEAEDATEKLGEDVVRTLKWVLGLTPPQRVTGLSPLITQLEG